MWHASARPRGKSSLSGRTSDWVSRHLAVEASRAVLMSDPLRSKDAKASYPIAVHPPTRALVLPSSHSSTLQFVDPFTSAVLFDLEVAPSNRVSRRDEKNLEPVSVERLAFANATEGPNRWMATVEGRKGDETEGGGLVKNLKFWRWVEDKWVVSSLGVGMD